MNIFSSLFGRNRNTSRDISNSDNSREIEFVIPCGICGYKTNVRVVIDWVGNILSGEGKNHRFLCLNCNKYFLVDKESLKQYTNRFV